MSLPLAGLVRAGLAIAGLYLLGEVVEKVMGHSDATYVIFDGDNNQWAYRFMRGWKASERVDFDFRDAHDLGSMTSRAQDETYVKSQLRERMNKAKQVIVLVGESTKSRSKKLGFRLNGLAWSSVGA